MKAGRPTMKVEFGDSFMIINQSDFDPEVHTVYEEPTEAADSGDDESSDSEAFDNTTVVEIKEALDDAGIEYPSGAKKPELWALLQESK